MNQLSVYEVMCLVSAYTQGKIAECQLVAALALDATIAKSHATLQPIRQSSRVGHPDDVIDADWYEVKQLPLISL